MFLCRTVFHCSVKEAKIKVSNSELSDWQAFYAIEPWGDDWEQVGLIVTALVIKYSKSPVYPEYFIPYQDEFGHGLYRRRALLKKELEDKRKS